jgi:hypothetical protein
MLSGTASKWPGINDIWTCYDPSHLPVSGQRAFPADARTDPAFGWPHDSRRPALCHREWALRLQPGSASLAAGWPAWHEFDLLGCTLTIGKTGRLKVVKRIQRCAATDVDPDTGIRDLTIPRTLMDNFNHTDCGVYAEVMAAGDIVVSDAVDVAVS